MNFSLPESFYFYFIWIQGRKKEMTTAESCGKSGSFLSLLHISHFRYKTCATAHTPLYSRRLSTCFFFFFFLSTPDDASGGFSDEQWMGGVV